MMDIDTVNEVIECVGRLFDHIPYAVCGTAALIHYGYRSYFPDHISITCPEESKEAIRCWALAKGMTPLPDNPDGFSVRVASGRTCPVCIKFMKNGFEALERVRVGPGQASMVTLPSIANTIARSYVSRLHNSSTERQALYARYLAWILKRMAEVPSTDPIQRFTPERAKDIINRSFWIPFTLSYPETVPLFSAAGLDVPSDGGLLDLMDMDWQMDVPSVPAQRPRARTSTSRYSLNSGHGRSQSHNFANTYNYNYSQSQTRHSLPDSDVSESENSTTPPSLRRVTKRIPSFRPLMVPSFNSPATSDSGFSHSTDGGMSPGFLLASPFMAPTTFMSPTTAMAPPPFTNYHQNYHQNYQQNFHQNFHQNFPHFMPLSPSDSTPFIQPLGPPPAPRRSLSTRSRDVRPWI